MKETYSTFEAADILGMGEHRAQVVAWIRRHLKPSEIDRTNPKKEIYKLDLANIFELYLLRELKRRGFRLGDINQIMNKSQVAQLLESDEPLFLTVYGETRIPILLIDPMALWLRSKGAASAFIVNLQELKRQVLDGIKKVQG